MKRGVGMRGRFVPGHPIFRLASRTPFPFCRTMASHHSIGLLNGPNLGRLGLREPDVYGRTSLASIESVVAEEAKLLGVRVECFHSNHEGALIDRLEKWTDEDFCAFVVNPGGLTHTSVALRDALTATGRMVVEVHLSNVHRRENFRRESLTAGACEAVVAGMGPEGYLAALRFLAARLKSAKGRS